MYEDEKNLGVKTALIDLLEHIVSSDKLSEKEKKKKVKKFKISYPDIYGAIYPPTTEEPDFMTNKKKVVQMGNETEKNSAVERSLSRLKSVIRL